MLFLILFFLSSGELNIFLGGAFSVEFVINYLSSLIFELFFFILFEFIKFSVKPYKCLNIFIKSKAKNKIEIIISATAIPINIKPPVFFINYFNCIISL